jgi:hypothetical protein
MKHLAPFSLSFALLLGCGEPPPPPAPPPVEASPAPPPEATPSPLLEQARKAADVANNIAAVPDGADEYLTQAGWSRKDYESLLVEIAKDPDASAAFAAIRTQ